MTNVKLVHELYQALNARDIEGVLGVLDPSIEVKQSNALPWGGCYRGLAGAKTFLMNVASQLNAEVMILKYIDAGECVAAIGQTKGLTILTDTPFEVNLVHIWRLRKGMVSHLEVFVEQEDMLRALAGEHVRASDKREA